MSRLAFQVLLFALPFLLFGIYRIAIAEAKQDGRKPWPIKWLFSIGLILAVGSWLFFIFLDGGKKEVCYRESRLVNGEMVRGEQYPCEKDLSTAGKPRTNDPGGVGRGVGAPDPAGPDGSTPMPGDDSDVQPIIIDENTNENVPSPR
jgi:hypothetical protein